MAIVFDTQAELEAFCEAFELRSVAQEGKVSRKFRKVERMKAEKMPDRQPSGNPHGEAAEPGDLASVMQLAEAESVSLPTLLDELPVPPLASAS